MGVRAEVGSVEEVKEEADSVVADLQHVSKYSKENSRCDKASRLHASQAWSAFQVTKKHASLCNHQLQIAATKPPQQVRQGQDSLGGGEGGGGLGGGGEGGGLGGGGSATCLKMYWKQ